MPINFNDLFNSVDSSLNNQKIEDFFSKTKEAAETVGQKSAERLEISRKKVECLDAKAKLAKLYEKFGKLQYGIYIGEEADEAEIAGIANDIAMLTNKIEQYTIDIEEAKAAFNESVAAAAKKTKEAFKTAMEHPVDEVDTEVEVVDAEPVSEQESQDNQE